MQFGLAALGEGAEPYPGAGCEGADCEGSEAVERGGAVAVLFRQTDGLDAGGTKCGVAAQHSGTDGGGDFCRYQAVADKADDQAEEQ